MIGSVWLTVFVGGPVVLALLVAWWGGRHMYRLHLRRKRWQTRRARVLLLRTVNDLDYQARVLRAVARMDELEDIRAEILEGSKEPPLALVTT